MSPITCHATVAVGATALPTVYLIQLGFRASTRYCDYDFWSAQLQSQLQRRIHESSHPHLETTVVRRKPIIGASRFCMRFPITLG